tara:strand:+ start:258 stop:689 length:432 start_codon:yes stop_codon:yes gene_type:complete
MPEHDWWIPCSRVAGLTLNQPPPDWEAFNRKFVLVERDDEAAFGRDYESLDGDCTITIVDEGICGANFTCSFFVAGADIIGRATNEAISIITAEFDLSAKPPSFDTWVEVAPNVLQRFIYFDELCLFLTENEADAIIAADVYG